ncbi:MAG: phosphotransferase, partial [Eubacteriales bacterium]|nr:phosphotransferase [Eubacteriales bacterium]
EAGIAEIYVVVGFMKERFFYLEQKYEGVQLVVNNAFDKKGNLLSIYAAREHFGNTYVCCADQYFVVNPFCEEPDYSYRACTFQEGRFQEFQVAMSNEGIITDFHVGGHDSYCMVGHAYFTQSFSEKFLALIEVEKEEFGVANLFWEEFYARHQKDLTLHGRIMEENEVLEFDSVEELRSFDQDFLNNIDSGIVNNICQILKCEPNEIKQIEVIQKGLTNVSFSFVVKDVQYIYRHPGGTSGSLVDRQAEVYSQYLARDLGLDKSVIYIDPTGWKLSYFVGNQVTCDFEKYPEQLQKGMEYLRKLHQADFETIKDFDTYEEAIRLMDIASPSKGDLRAEFADLVEKVGRLDQYIKADGYPRVLSHNDTYEPNYLVTEDGDMYLIDWEYTGVNDPANDLACILSRYYFTDEQIEKYFLAYFGRELTEEEHRHYIAYIALSGFYWFCWGMYKGSVNDDDGFFLLQAYRNCIRFIDQALASYEK